jgi:hypothetical protein
MSRPPLITRVAGSPLPAVLLFAGYAAIIAGWYEGQLTWWLALMAAGASVRTISAVARVRRYKAWLAEWNAMGRTEQPAPKPKRGSRRWIFITGAVLLLLAIPASSPYMQGNDTAWAAAVTVWIAAFVYLAGVVLRRITRRRTKRSKVEAKAEAAPVVECMLGRASGSPSRADAARQLPKYTNRLLGA